MPTDMNVLSEQVTNRTFSDCSIEELQQLITDYPAFSPAHFLLLKKLDPSSEAYREQYQKAILYFHDPLSFEYFINKTPADFALDLNDDIPDQSEGTGNDGIVTDSPAAGSIQPGALNEEAINPESLHTETVQPEAQHAETIAATEDEQVAEQILKEQPAAAVTTPPVNEEISFEPFHTVDYFASQGIKLSQEETSNDKFGKQVKSFTDWLKTMKRLPAVQKSTPDPVTEQKVEHLADNSVQETEIFTEAMAEVWLKQGNREKAAEVYRKLSLSDPSKSAYFAAKIESLQ